jgi:predicted porin
MKRTLIAAAAVLAAGTSFAQSSVTLYGRVNTTVEYQTTETLAGVKTHVSTVQNNASRWGLRGVEDLGGGLKGLFVLESGFNSDTGAGAANGLFGRESWVGVQGNFGRVRLGNLAVNALYYATADYISMHNHDTGTSSDAFYLYPGATAAGGNAVALRNAVAYNTPSIGGLVVEGQFGLKEVPTGTPGKNVGVIAANYDRGPLHLGGGYAQGPAVFTLPGLPTTDNDKQFGLRALYEFGPVTAGAYWIRDKAESGALEGKRDTYRLSAMYAFGGSELHANVGFANDVKLNGVKQADTRALQYTLGYNYNLSKRTKVYAFYTVVNSDRAATYNGAPGTDFSSLALGVRHNF